MVPGAKLKTSHGNGRIVFGFICSAFGLLFMLYGAGEGFDSGVVVMIFLFFGGGALLLFFGYKSKKQHLIYRRYINVIINKKLTEIDTIAHETKDSPQKVNETIHAMLEIGFFPGAYIDEDVRKLVFPNQPAPRPETLIRSSVQKCSNCGAHNTVFAGRINICEYCGSPLR